MESKVSVRPFGMRDKIGKKRLLTASALISVLAGIAMLVAPITPDTKGIIIYVAGLMLVNSYSFNEIYL